MLRFNDLISVPSKFTQIMSRMKSDFVNKYKHSKIGEFSQVSPSLTNPYTTDPLLDRAILSLLPKQYYHDVSGDLKRFGDRIVKEIDQLGRQAELEPPKLEHQDAWGNRVDKLIVSPAWYKLKEIAAEEGLISIGYDSKVDPKYRRIHQISKLYLFGPSSGLVSCPLAMTDGAAKTIKELKLDEKYDELKNAYDRLVSRNGKEAWTSGQWMTEKRGGSDVGSGCDTYATDIGNGKYLLNGYKWFSSAVDADICLTLARVINKDGNIISGSKGLSLFYLPIKNPKTMKLNGIQMVTLKDKLGTRQLPTAELLLDGVEAIKISDEGRGIPSVANMLNITRIHNAIASVSYMRRIISLARDYSTKRNVFGRKLSEWPLHLATLSKLEVECRAGLLFILEAGRLLGIQESGEATSTEILNLRLMTPVLKLYTGKKTIPLISEGLECFGGQGYIENTGLPSILRDAQVTPIWEGTTNVLSLDVLRVFSSKENVFGAFETHINNILKNQKSDKLLDKCTEKVRNALEFLKLLFVKISEDSKTSPLQVDRGAREIGMIIGKIYSGALLIQFASSELGTESDKIVAFRYCVENQLIDFDYKIFNSLRNSIDTKIIFENYPSEKSKL
ncbi:Short-chain specific acyl-CoA dehydrogenase, mitochondrial [Strongyloides ratti]|uniref:Short-chain specific acyl-CoA dehydrogenase, mitochondrial n=1 Tax=Strongyloides ratti TaxID=34506 RepID=A0A090L1J2_STRRB|nr:Short-chain specific acyl-CoA dehydrogenase, mitochondrial [Strongyloides ratti]CEF63651.1 Short-chain specific acyl-CoA dehydrogenase, mitochondrial [Strongyloides ratti]